MKKIIIAGLFVFLGAVSGYAQYSETIRSGRPGQSIGAYTVGRKVFQAQGGITYLEKPNDGFADLMLRYAVSDRLEFNTNVNYQYVKSQAGAELRDFDLGTRINLDKGEDELPAMGLQLSFNVPVIDEIEFGSKVLFIVSFDFSDKTNLTLNVGSDFDKNFDTNALYTVNFSYKLTDKISMFVEPYGNANDVGFNLKADGGFAFLVHKDIQLDILGGYGLMAPEGFEKDGLMVGAGISWRVLAGDPSVKTN